MTRNDKGGPSIPSWFSLEKYAQAAQLDSAGWYLQLVIRARCFDYLRDGGTITPMLLMMREAPIIDMHSSFFRHYRYALFDRRPIIEASLHGVHSLTVHEFYLAAINMDERTQTEVREFFEVVLGHKKNADPSFRLNMPASLFGAVHDVLAKPLDQALLCVNLQLPDRELVEQFKAYLPKLREECQAQYYKSKRHKPDFLEWERLRVLPFLDLQLWQMEQNVKLTFNDMEQLLFPDGESSEDRVRKTTAPKAEELVSERFLTVLYNLATSEKRTG